MNDPVYVIPDDVELQRDVVSGKGGGRDLHMHILRPRSMQPGERLPAVVFIHGGFWMGGTRDRGLERLPALVQRGYIGASVEYRLTDEAIWPAQIEDCKMAIRYLRAHADEYGIDPERIGVWGGSAGGHLSAMVGLTSDISAFEGTGGWPEQSTEVKAVVQAYGITDLLHAGDGFPGPRREDGSLVHPDHAQSPESKLIGGSVQEHREAAMNASPTTYVRSEVPPFFNIAGTGDVLVHWTQTQLLHEALVKAGASSELQMYPDAGHMYMDDAGLERVYAFFDKHLKESTGE